MGIWVLKAGFLVLVILLAGCAKKLAGNQALVGVWRAKTNGSQVIVLDADGNGRLTYVDTLRTSGSKYGMPIQWSWHRDGSVDWRMIDEEGGSSGWKVAEISLSKDSLTFVKEPFHGSALEYVRVR